MRLFPRLVYAVFFFMNTLALQACAVSMDDEMNQDTTNTFTQGTRASFEQTKQAAEVGDPDAEYALGYKYYYGEGVQRDSEAARTWMHKAAIQGQPLAIKALKMIEGVDHDKMAKVDSHTPSQVGDGYIGKTTSATPVQTSQEPVSPKISPKVQSSGRVEQQPYVTTAVNSHQKSGDTSSISGNEYTIQLMGSHEKQLLQQFIAKQHLQKEAAIYHTYYQDKDWYVLIYGKYPTRYQATAAMQELPLIVRQLKPWVKSFADVQKGMQIK